MSRDVRCVYLGRSVFIKEVIWIVDMRYLASYKSSNRKHMFVENKYLGRYYTIGNQPFKSQKKNITNLVKSGHQRALTLIDIQKVTATLSP